jgi:hypothetical protein
MQNSVNHTSGTVLMMGYVTVVRFVPILKEL